MINNIQPSNPDYTIPADVLEQMKKDCKIAMNVITERAVFQPTLKDIEEAYMRGAKTQYFRWKWGEGPWDESTVDDPQLKARIIQVKGLIESNRDLWDKYLEACRQRDEATIEAADYRETLERIKRCDQYEDEHKPSVPVYGTYASIANHALEKYPQSSKSNQP